MLNKIYRKLVGYRNRVNYWSCSKAAKKFGNYFGLDFIGCGTSEEFREEEKRNKKANKFVYWIIDDVFDFVQDIIYFPYDIYCNICYYFENRFIYKTHYLPTKLKVGEYSDLSHRLLHAMGESVVDFVEVEKAHMNDICKVDDDNDYPKDRREAGMSYLDWEINLGEENPTQSEAAKEIKKIYLWWKDIRPNRDDPYEVTGWSEYCKGRDVLANEKTEEERNKTRELLKALHKIEEEYENEDQEMLHRIINIRQSLWT